MSNGKELFLVAGIDGRSREARRYRDILAALVAHLGGDDHVTEVRRHLAKRAAALTVWCEIEEAKLALGEEIDIGAFTTAVNSLRRLLQDIGFDRVAKDVTSLSDYLAKNYGTGEAAE